MNRWIALIVVAAVTSAASFVVLNPERFGLNEYFGKTSSSGTPAMDELLQYVPADTVYFLGGRITRETADFFDGNPLLGGSPTQEATWQETLSGLGDDGSKFARFVLSVLTALNQNTNGSVGEVVDFLGVSRMGAFAVYGHGAVPVIRFPLADPARFFSHIDKAAQESGVEVTEKNLGGAAVKSWNVKLSKAKKGFRLAVAVQDNTLIASMFSDADDDQVIKSRLGLRKPEQSLATSGEVEGIVDQYHYTEDFVMLVNFARLLQAFMEPQSNSFGRDLLHYISSAEVEKMQEKLTPECKADYADFIAKVPRLVGGYQSLVFQNGVAAFEFQTLLEITNVAVTTELAKLRGHIPLHATKVDNKLMTFGSGIDMDNTIPALTNLWNQFISAEFACDRLVTAQDNARQANPAMAGMFLGMVQGVKGLGLSIYDLQFDMTSMTPEGGSALLSIATQNPQTLAGLASMLPLPAGLQIPADGSAVDVPLPLLPPDLNVKAAIKGKQLAVYTGAAAELDLRTLTSESLDPNGLYSFGVDYRRIFEVADRLAQLSGDSSTTKRNAQTCAFREEMKEIFAQLNMDFTLVGDVDERGSVMRMQGNMDRIDTVNPDVVGTFKIETLDDDCQWMEVGIDQLQAERKGSYQKKDPAADCLLRSADYTWEKQGSRLIFTTTDAKTRDTCEENWQTGEVGEQTCYLFAADKDSFKCMYDPVEHPVVYRYTRD